MLPLTANVTNLIGLTGASVVIGLAAVFFIRFLVNLAQNILENL